MKKQEELQAAAKIKELMEEHDYTIWTELEHVSQSGMLRRISCFVKDDKDYKKDITHLVSKVSGYNEDKNKPGLRVTGGGMDMGFAVVYDTSSKIYRNEDGSYSHDGAYKIKQRWI